jgi:hypothetical protein
MAFTRDEMKIKAAYYDCARRQHPDDEPLPPTWEAVPLQYRMLLIDMWHAGKRDAGDER